MKRIITSALILALTIGAAQAQTTDAVKQKHHHHRKEHSMAFKKLNLSSGQKEQLKAIRKDFHQQAMDLKKQDQITVAEMRSRRKELHQQFRTKTESVLTADQKNQLAKLRAERKEKRSVAWHKKASKIQKELNLTQAQKDKMKEMRTGFRTQFQSIRNDKSLTSDQKKEKIKGLMKQQHKQMSAVLTKEQLQKLQSLKKEREEKNSK